VHALANLPAVAVEVGLDVVALVVLHAGHDVPVLAVLVHHHLLLDHLVETLEEDDPVLDRGAEGDLEDARDGLDE
jgi:hypothetical protein